MLFFPFISFLLLSALCLLPQKFRDFCTGARSEYRRYFETMGSNHFYWWGQYQESKFMVAVYQIRYLPRNRAMFLKLELNHRPSQTKNNFQQSKVMNAVWTRFLKSAYRKEPISSFILILGAVDAVIGGVGTHWTLFSFGMMTVLLAAVLRWWQIQKAQALIAEETPRYFLPPHSSRPPLPMLTHENHRR